MMTGQIETAFRQGKSTAASTLTGERTAFPRTGSETLLLVSLSAAALTAARSESTVSMFWLITSSIIFTAIPWLFWIGLQFSTACHRRIDAVFPAMVTAWTVAPIIFEVAGRQVGVGDAPELVQLLCVQNAALIAAAYGHRWRCQQIATLLSAFLALFAIVIGSNRAVFVLAGLFGVMMLWWLMARYWERVRRTQAASQTDRCLPMRSTVLGAVALIALLLLATLGTTRASTYVLRGFMPSSGGNRWSDEFARSGVGDGDAMVAAEEDAMSFGPVESELFLESEMPSLYDIASDMYGEPPKPNKKSQRAIALTGVPMKEKEQRIAKTERSGREFSTVRRKVERERETLEDRDAAALLYLVGRVPLHLALERYDTFDGRQWTHSGPREQQPDICLNMTGGKPWMHVKCVGMSPVYRGQVPHALKIINLKTARIPSPPHLTAVHIDKVDQIDFFGWTKDGALYMPVREHLPQLAVLHLRSQGVNLEPLRKADFSTHLPRSDVPGDRHDLISIAAQWTRGVPRGWRQVEAIVARLRSGFEVDRDATAPEDCQNVVAYFLKAHRGPDYMFATTAAMLLRQLGYPTRLVTGFYARSDRYDHRAGQTAVLAEDVHVWAEVKIDGSTWIPIEPTPGYDPPRESLTWPQRLSQAWQVTRQWCATHAWSLVAVLSAAVVLWATRVRWLDCIFTLLCRSAGCGSARRRVLWTMRLLEWRAWLAGHPRPPAITLSSWHGALVDSLPSATSDCLKAALRSAEAVLYCPANSPTVDTPFGTPQGACSVVARNVGIADFRHAYGKSAPPEVCKGSFRK
jgi:transglutaminase-like putative cysteine protease